MTISGLWLAASVWKTHLKFAHLKFSSSIINLFTISWWRGKVCPIVLYGRYGFPSVMVLMSWGFAFRCGRPGLGSSSRSVFPLRNFEVQSCTAWILIIPCPSALSNRARVYSSEAPRRYKKCITARPSPVIGGHSDQTSEFFLRTEMISIDEIPLSHRGLWDIVTVALSRADVRMSGNVRLDTIFRTLCR
jgi:hypothetical protein